MKFSNLCVFVLLFMASKAQQNGYYIEGILEGIGNSKVILGNKPNGYSQAFKLLSFDSCFSKNDTFHFSGIVKFPDIYSIEVEGKRGWMSFVLSNDSIFIRGYSDKIWTSSVAGSLETKFYNNLYDSLASISLLNNFYVRQLDSMRKLNLQNSMQWDSIEAIVAKITIARHSYLFNFIKMNPERFASLDYLLQYSHEPKMNADSLRKYYLLLSNELQESPKGRALNYLVYRKDSMIKAGGQVPNFELVAENDRRQTLQDFTGKYVLLDFWASWCGPCIAEFPTIKTLYEKYKSQGLEILGISLDIDRENWLNAVQEHAIPWPTFCDLQGNESEPYRIFDGIKIPMYVLVDQAGQLVSLDPGVEEISELLEKIFGF